MIEGLAFTDLERWQEWTASRDRARQAVRRLKAGIHHRVRVPVEATLWEPSGPVRQLVVLDKPTPGNFRATEAPLKYLDRATTAILAPVRDLDLPSDGSWTGRTWSGGQDLPASITEVLSMGSYLGLAGVVAEWAHRRDVRHSVVQHGLLTPWSPPPAPGDHLLAWSQEDAAFWSAGQASVTTEVVGSQMLWQAATLPRSSIVSERPVMLGQLHGLELGRRSCFSTYWRFCRSRSADYRPHPNEQDVMSRSLHRVMRARGITFEASGVPLAELRRPVVSIFSTGTLEAAHRGLPAWVYHADPPTWVRDFWRRYRLAEWGSDPTQAWAGLGDEPAKRVAAALGG